MNERKVVLVGLDGSEAARAAFRVAMKEAEWRADTSVCVFHVVFVPMVLGRSLKVEPASDLEEYGHFVVDRELELLREEYEGGFPVPVERRVRLGHIGTELLAAAEDPELDLQMVVLGTRGLGGFSSLMLGSVTTYAIHHLHAPLMVVPLPQETASAA